VDKPCRKLWALKKAGELALKLVGRMVVMMAVQAVVLWVY
jgi:hypothetical protein